MKINLVINTQNNAFSQYSEEEELHTKCECLANLFETAFIVDIASLT